MNPSLSHFLGLAHLPHKPTIFSFENLRQLHAKLITSGLLSSDPSCFLSLLKLFCPHPSALHQASSFAQFQTPLSVTWRHLVVKLGLTDKPFRVVYLFNAIRRTTHNDHLLCDPYLYASLIKASNSVSAVRQGKSIHCHVVRLGLDSNVNISNSLICLYASSLKSMKHACVLFDRIPEKTVVTVNCMISGFVKNGFFDLALSFFNRILGCSLDGRLRPNHVTMVILLSGCVEFVTGTSLKAYCWKMGYLVRPEVSNVLIDFYARFGNMNDAAKLFDDMSARDLISWNTMILGYTRSKNCGKAISLFTEMMSNNIECDRVSLISMILASANEGNLKMVKAVHGYIKSKGIKMSLPLGIVLINMYSKCGLVDSVKNVFDELPNDNIAVWNSMIHGLVECGRNLEAFSLFNVIQSRMLLPDEVTMLGLIMACKTSGDICHCIDIDSYIESNSTLKESIILQNSLIDMYAKCGSMSKAKFVFDKMPVRDVISWTSIIVGYAVNGEGEKAIAAYHKMEAEKIEPNHVTFIGVLSACDHAGLIDEGIKLYDAMCQVYNIEPRIEHCGCMVDMLARAGKVEEAYDFVKKMPVQPNAVIWRMLVNACRVNADIDLGLGLVSGLMKLKTFHTAEDHVLSSNIFAEAGKWDDVLQERRLMTSRKFIKAAGKSTISNLTE